MNKTHRVLTLTVNPTGRIVGVGISRPRTWETASQEVAKFASSGLPVGADGGRLCAADHTNEALRGCTRRLVAVRAERFPRNYDCLDLLGRDAVDVAAWLVTMVSKRGRP